MALAFAPAPQIFPTPRRWTPGEFARMRSAGLFDENERAALENGEVFVNGRLKLWTTDEYARLINCGAVQEGERSELFQGRVIERELMNPPHAIAISKTQEVLRWTFGRGRHVRVQLPIALRAGSAPEPDILVVPGSPDEYSAHPTAVNALLLVEISDATLVFDRGEKMRAYGAAGVADYWVLDLNGRQLEVYRGPSSVGYSEVTVYAESESVTPLAAPESSLSVADLLPIGQTQ